MLDTSVVIELLRGKADWLLPRLDKQRADLSLSAATVMELEYGIERSTQPSAMRHDVDQLLALIRVREFDRAAARQAGQIRATLARQGIPIGPYDSLIAGHALSLGLAIVTHNMREFTRVPGLVAEDWLAR